MGIEEDSEESDDDSCGILGVNKRPAAALGNDPLAIEEFLVMPA